MMKTTELDQAPVRRYELLGETLAILDGIADANEDKTAAAKILQNYPHTSVGAPVVWPQMEGVQVDHNRAIWPFVSSYLIKAAAKGRNADVVNRNFETLINGAALNLSNMENFEFTILAVTAAQDVNRPQIDSDKQLWSIGGYIGSVLDVVFGRDVNMDGIRFEPYITKQMHINVFNGARQLHLKNLDYRGKKITVKVNLPAAGSSTSGYYTAKTASLNGAQIDLKRFTPASELKNDKPNVFEIGLIDNTENGGTARVGSTTTDLSGPVPVNLNITGYWAATKNADGLVELTWSDGTPDETAISVMAMRSGRSIRVYQRRSSGWKCAMPANQSLTASWSSQSLRASW